MPVKKHGLSDQVREIARSHYVEPAISAGRREFSIPVRGMLETLAPLGFPANNTPQVCSAIQAGKFLRENKVEIVGIDGPASKISTTVVVHYRVIDDGETSISAKQPHPSSAPTQEETPERKAARLCGKLRGILKDEITAHGGGEAFLRWLRAEDEEAA
jgi:hypothetical protein